MTRPAREHTCERSGFRLVHAHPDTAFRVGQKQYGADGARDRDFAETSSSQKAWSRWDRTGRTLYFERRPQGAYAEVLASFRHRRMFWLDDPNDPLVRTAERLEIAVQDLWDILVRERATLGIGINDLPAPWRHARRVYEYVLPAQGWWVDIAHPDTLAALDRHITDGGRALSDTSPLVALGEDALQARLAALPERYRRGLTLGDVMGDDRILTTTLAELIASSRLDDDSVPLGLRYDSKWGAGECWAAWGPDVYDRLPDTSRDVHVFRVVDEHTIEAGSSALAEVTARWGLTIEPD